MPTVLPHPPGATDRAGSRQRIHLCRARRWALEMLGEQRARAARGDSSRKTVPFSSEAVAVACGSEFVCAILESDAVECWDPVNAGSTIAVTASSHGASKPVAISSGIHTCILGSAGPSENLVSGEAEDRIPNVRAGTAWPAALLGPDVVGVSLGGYVTCANYRAGTVKCWGIQLVRHLGTTRPDEQCPMAERSVMVLMKTSAPMQPSWATTSLKR